MTQVTDPTLKEHWLVAQCFKVGTLAGTAPKRSEDAVRGPITNVSPDGTIQFSGIRVTPADNIDFIFNEGALPLRAKTKDGETGQVLRVLWLPENASYSEMHRVLFKLDNSRESFFVYRLDELSPDP